MIQQINFTGDRKMMNMAKVSTVSPVKVGSFNRRKTAETRMDKGIRSIHYAYQATSKVK